MCPNLLVYGGPNGSGKSTVTAFRSPTGHYVNADEIERCLGCSDIEAAQIAEQTRETLLAAGETFTMESVLSTERNFNLMRRAKASGYTVQCVYMLTKDPEINVARVAERVKKGGHDVPPSKTRERYWRAMSKIPELFDICDECYIFDNSLDRAEGKPVLIVSWVHGTLELYPCSVWTQKMLEALVDGKYSLAG